MYYNLSEMSNKTNVDIIVVVSLEFISFDLDFYKTSKILR